MQTLLLMRMSDAGPNTLQKTSQRAAQRPSVPLTHFFCEILSRSRVHYAMRLFGRIMIPNCRVHTFNKFELQTITSTKINSSRTDGNS